MVKKLLIRSHITGVTQKRSKFFFDFVLHKKLREILRFKLKHKRNFEKTPKDIFSGTMAPRKGLKSSFLFYFEEDATGLLKSYFR